MDDDFSQVLAWADDTWLFATPQEQLDLMVVILRRVAKRVAGPGLRLERCTRAKVC